LPAARKLPFLICINTRSQSAAYAFNKVFSKRARLHRVLQELGPMKPHRPARLRGTQAGAADARWAAARPFHPTIEQPDVAAVMSFCSSEYHVDALRGETRRLFIELLVVGGTIAGESQFP